MTAATIGEALTLLGRRVPWAKAAGWDPVGLQIGDPDRTLRRAAVCHEVTGPVVDALDADPVDLLVAYHPLLFRPVTALTAGPGPGGRALRLAGAGIALAVVHTAFDAAPGGAADALAEALDLADVEGFGPLPGSDSVKVVTFVPADAADRVAAAMGSAGAGVIGNYTGCSFRLEGTGTFLAGEGTVPVVGRSGELNRAAEVRVEMVAPRALEARVVAGLVAAHPYEEPAYDVYDRRGEAGLVGRVGSLPPGTTLADVVELAARLGGAVRVAGEGSAPVGRVAVVPGSGGDFVEEAARLGAEVVVTGDVSHHTARSALESGVAVIDAGHAATELPGVARLVAMMAELVDDVTDLSGVDPGPWEAGG